MPSESGGKLVWDGPLGITGVEPKFEVHIHVVCQHGGISCFQRALHLKNSGRSTNWPIWVFKAKPGSSD